MNVTLKPQASPADKPKFPVLMEYVGASESQRGGIVLFIAPREGINIKGMQVTSHTGIVEKDWCRYDDEDVWRKYEGVVELSN